MNQHNVKILRAVLAGYNEQDGWLYWSEGDFVNIPAIGLATCVYSYIPVEEDGRPAEFVFKVDTDEETLHFKRTAYFYSYRGIDWNSGDFRRVYPKEKVVYEYE